MGKDTWQTFTIGFSNLTQEQVELIDRRLKAFTDVVETALGVTCEASTTDGGEV